MQRTESGSSGLAFSVLVLFLLIASLVFSMILSFLPKENQSAQWVLYLQYLCSTVALAGGIVWYFYNRKKPVKEWVKEQKCSWKYYLVAVVLQVGLFSLSELNGYFVSWLEGLGLKVPQPNIPSLEGFGFVGVLFVVGVLPAISEELFFRGVLLDGAKVFGKVGAVLLCGGLFSLYHQSPAQTVYQFCCGTAFALIALRAGSVLPTVIAHFLNNAFIIVMTKLGYSFSGAGWIVFLVISALCLIGSLVYLIFLDKKEDAEEKTGTRMEFLRGVAVGVTLCVMLWVSSFGSAFIK